MSTRERNLATSVATSSAKLSTLRTAPLRAQVRLLSMKPINKCDCHECCLVLAPNTHIEVFTSYAVDRSMIKRRCEPAKPLQWRPSVNNIMYPAHLLVNARRLPGPYPARDRVGVWPIVLAPVSRFRSSTPPLAQAMRSPQGWCMYSTPSCDHGWSWRHWRWSCHPSRYPIWRSEGGLPWDPFKSKQQCPALQHRAHGAFQDERRPSQQ